MNKKNIKIIQNILKEQNRYDLAIKLENCYYKDYLIDGWNGGIGEIELYVNPINYLFFKDNLSQEDEKLLIKLFDGLPHEYYEIQSLKFSIDTEIVVENLSKTLYIFVDEAGDMDFSQNGTKHYMFSFLVKQRPFTLHEYISNYRYSLLERNLDPLQTNKLDIEYFHATNDNRYIRDEIFKIISTFEEEKVKLYSYILEKPKVLPNKRNNKDTFYIENLKYAIKKLLDKLQIATNFIIITDRLPLQKNKKSQIKALKQGIQEYIRAKKLDIRYDIFHHCSASSVNLQIVDYLSWAIFRKFEKQDTKYYDKIKDYILNEDIMTKDRNVNHY